MTPFGITATGETVHRLTLTAGDLTVALLTWGAVLQSVRLDGIGHDLTLGSENLADYEGAMRHHGSLIGPVVNRFTGATAPIAGEVHRFEANQDNRITLHSGSAGTHLKVWRVEDHGPAHATLALDLPHGEGGFPGNRRVNARFEVTIPATLTMTVRATTDRPTLLNFANHAYWNLDGSAFWSGHRLWIAADRYLPTTPDFTPTGEIVKVAGTAMDFRQEREIAVGAPLFDNCFCLGDRRGPLRDALRLTGQNGLTMTVATTEPGIQVYDGRDARRPGKGAHEGLAIEAQGWPDAPNHEGFPSIEVPTGAPYEQTTRWTFT